MISVALGPLGIIVEPEGHMAHDKRADIAVAMPKRKVLCELKRDHHPDVWSAADAQLERFYVHDPNAQGFGVYLVLWFGGKRGQVIPKPPGGQKRPRSAEEMQHMLDALLPEERRHRIAIRVIDVSGGVLPSSARVEKLTQKKKRTAPARRLLPRSKPKAWKAQRKR